MLFPHAKVPPFNVKVPPTVVLLLKLAVPAPDLVKLLYVIGIIVWAPAEP